MDPKLSKGITHACLEPIVNHSEASDVPYTPNQFLGCNFFRYFLQQDSSSDFGHLFEDGNQEFRREGWTEKRLAVCFCLGSGLCGSYNSD